MTIDILPFDLTATITTNKKTEKVIPANPINKGFVICPEWGAFYSDTLVIRDAYNRALVKGEDYNVAYLYEEYTLLTSKEVMGIILINNNKEPPFTITAQYIGGDAFVSSKQIKQAIDDVLNSEIFKFSFWDILNRPTEFIPTKHQHDLWQLLGMNTTVDMVKEINKAIIDRFNEEVPINIPLKKYAENKLREVENEIRQLENLVNSHYLNRDNPHEDNKDKLGLNNVVNLSLANAYESLSEACDYRYQTAYGVYRKIDQSVDIANHINSINPHGLTIGQLGGLTKSQWDIKFNQYLNVGGVAANATTLEKNTIAQIYAQVGKDLNAEGYNGPIWTTSHLGINNTTEVLKVLCADQQYRTISSMFNNYPVNRNALVSIGYFPNETDAYQHLISNYVRSPISTLAMVNIADLYPFDYVKANLTTPLDATSKLIGNIVIYKKTSTDWIKL